MTREPQVTYWSISIFNSRTFWMNAVAFVVAVLSLSEIVTIIPATWMGTYTAILAILNIILRTQTVRPASFIAPGTAQPVQVDRIAPPKPPAVTD